MARVACLFIFVALSVMWITLVEGDCTVHISGGESVSIPQGTTQEVQETCERCTCGSDDTLSCVEMTEDCNFAGNIGGS